MTGTSKRKRDANDDTDDESTSVDWSKISIHRYSVSNAIIELRDNDKVTGRFHFDHSKLFNASPTFLQPSNDGKINTYILKVVEAGELTVFLLWLETGCFNKSVLNFGKSRGWIEAHHGMSASWLRLVSLSLLAEKLKTADLHILVMDMLVKLTKECAAKNNKFILYQFTVYECLQAKLPKTAEDSPLRRFLVDPIKCDTRLVANATTSELVLMLGEEIAKEWLSVGLKTMAMEKTIPPWTKSEKNAAEYHMVSKQERKEKRPDIQPYQGYNSDFDSSE